jgi:hypothetical protein
VVPDRARVAPFGPERLLQGYRGFIRARAAPSGSELDKQVLRATKRARVALPRARVAPPRARVALPRARVAPFRSKMVHYGQGAPEQLQQGQSSSTLAGAGPSHQRVSIRARGATAWARSGQRGSI